MSGRVVFLKRNFDTISALIVFSVIVFIYWVLWVSNVLRDVLVIVVSPVLTAIGVFIAHRLNEKIKNPKLRIVQWGRHDVYRHSARIFAEVENKTGREVARDARAIITIKKIIDKDREVNIDSEDLVTKNLATDDFLVSELTPRVEGEPIPWMIPEMPYHSKGLYDVELKHIANIGPGQSNRATILEVICLKDEQNKRGYYLRVFSEYGTEEIKVPTGLPPPNEYKSTRIVRCILKPGIYRFYLQVSADKAYPITGIIEVDSKEGEIKCIKPNQKPISLENLEPASRSILFIDIRAC